MVGFNMECTSGGDFTRYRTFRGAATSILRHEGAQGFTKGASATVFRKDFRSETCGMNVGTFITGFSFYEYPHHALIRSSG